MYLERKSCKKERLNPEPQAEQVGEAKGEREREEHKYSGICIQELN
jgi:hypothetical protein